MPGGTGECRQGSRTCINGTLICLGAGTPGTEVCDGKDNDCDGSTDEEDPFLGTACYPVGVSGCDVNAGTCTRSCRLGQLGLHRRPAVLPAAWSRPQRGLRRRRQRLRRQQPTRASTSERPPLLRRMQHPVRSTPTPSPCARAGAACAGPASPAGPTPTAAPATAASTSATPRALEVCDGATTTATAGSTPTTRTCSTRPSISARSSVNAAGAGRLPRYRQLPGLRHRAGRQPPRLDLQLPRHGARRCRAVPTRSLPRRASATPGTTTATAPPTSTPPTARARAARRQRHGGMPSARHLQVPGQTRPSTPLATTPACRRAPRSTRPATARTTTATDGWTRAGTTPKPAAFTKCGGASCRGVRDDVGWPRWAPAGSIATKPAAWTPAAPARGPAGRAPARAAGVMPWTLVNQGQALTACQKIGHAPVHGRGVDGGLQGQPGLHRRLFPLRLHFQREPVQRGGAGPRNRGGRWAARRCARPSGPARAAST